MHLFHNANSSHPSPLIELSIVLMVVCLVVISFVGMLMVKWNPSKQNMNDSKNAPITAPAPEISEPFLHHPDVQNASLS
jgi:flagellar basal body-associated protein FliL